MPRTLPLLLLALVLGAGALFWLSRTPADGVDPSLEGSSRLEGGLSPDAGPAADLNGAAADIQAQADGAGEPLREREALASTRSAKKPKEVVATLPDAQRYVGVVVDHFGLPVGGAKVKIESNDMRDRVGFSLDFTPKPTAYTGYTKSDGHFELPIEQPLGLKLNFEVEATGYRLAKGKRAVDGLHVEDLGTFVVVPGIAIEGLVVDEGGLPVEDATVYRVDSVRDRQEAQLRALSQMGFADRPGSVRTDKGGVFRLPHEEAGQVDLVVRHPDFLVGTWSGQTPEAGQLMPQVRVTLKRGAVLEGRLVGYPKGRRGVRVAAHQIEGEQIEDPDDQQQGFAAAVTAFMNPAGEFGVDVETDGTFRFSGLPRDGRFELRATEPDNWVETRFLSPVIQARSGDRGIVMPFDAGSTVTFQVLDRATQKPLTDFEVMGTWPNETQRLFFDPSGEMRRSTHPGGKVTLYEVRPPNGANSLSIRLRAPGYYDEWRTGIAVRDGQQVELGPLYLDRAPGLTFQVLDARTGKPIPRAKVSLTGSSEGLLDELEEGEEGPDLDGVVANADAASHKRTAGQTDREGKVRLTLFRAETATLNVRASRYADFTERNFVMEGGEKEYVVRMTQGSTLEFEVVDVNGLAVPSAMIYAKDGNPFRAMNADKNGRKRRTKVRAGTYFFAAQRVMNGMGRWGGGQQGDELAWQEFLVKEGETLQVQLILPAQMRMRGRVYADGQPLEGASVAARPIRGEERDARWMDATDDFRFMDATQTDAEGRFVIEGLEEGPYVLRVRHAEWAMTHQEKIQVVDGGEEITVVMPRTSIAGLITDQNGKPVEGAEVVAESAPSSDEEGAARSFMRGFMGSNGPSARTNAAGEFLLKGVAPERPVRLRVQARGFVARYSETFEVGRNELRGGTNVRLEPGGDISVTVVSDEPASGVRIVVATYTGEASPKPEDETVFLKGGRGSLKGLHPGPWKLSLTARGVGGVELGEPSEPITVNVEAGGQHEARFAQE